MERIGTQSPVLVSDSRLSSSETASAAQQIGSFQGQAVRVVEDASSLVANAAEELTFSASEEVERKLTDRKENSEQRSRLIDQVRLYIENGSGLDKNEFEALLKQLTLMATLRSSDVVDLVKHHFPDPTDAHAALVQAREALGARTDLAAEHQVALDDVLTEAIADLEAADGPNIRAGYNIAGVSPGGLREQASGLRILYRETVVDFTSYERTFANLSERFGADSFTEALQFITRALGADMAALTPSVSVAQLKEVMDGIYIVETLKTVHQDAESLLQRIEKNHGEQTVSNADIAQPLLRYRDVPVLVEAQILREMPFLLSPNGARDAELTQGVREIARSLPHRIFPSSVERANLLDGLQTILDRAVDREEAEVTQ